MTSHGSDMPISLTNDPSHGSSDACQDCGGYNSEADFFVFCGRCRNKTLAFDVEQAQRRLGANTQ